MKLSVIICTYNRDKYIYNALKSVAENDFPKASYELLLINNNCTDNTAAECQRFAADFPDVDYCEFVETNQGLSYARNRGIKESRGEALIFLDDDAFVQKDYLHQLHQFLEKYPDAMAWGGKISPIFETGEAPKWLSKWTYSWVSAIDKGREVVLFSSSNKKDYPIGANMGIRRQVFEECGYFNVALGRSKKNMMGGEEKDIFDKIASAGHKIYYFPNIDVSHVIPPQRVTLDFIRRMGFGVGKSEQMRTKALSRKRFFRRLLSEGVKWGATLLLWVYYTILAKPAVANALVIFRFHVTKGLLSC